MLLKGLYLSDFWPFRLHTERKRPTMHLLVPTLKRANVQGKESCLKKEVFAKAGWRMVMQKIWLKPLHCEEDGGVTTTKPCRNKAAHHGLVLKILSLKHNPSYHPNTFRRTESRGLP